VDGGHANGGRVLGRFKVDFLSFEEDVTFILSMSAGEDFDEGSLSRAVFPGQDMDFARTEVKTNVIEDAYAGKGLADVFRAQDDITARHLGFLSTRGLLVCQAMLLGGGLFP
jgi:hypothetical protein